MNQPDETQNECQDESLEVEPIEVGQLTAIHTVKKLQLNTYTFVNQKDTTNTVVIKYDATTGTGQAIEKFLQENLTRHTTKKKKRTVAHASSSASAAKKTKTDMYEICREALVLYMTSLVPLSGEISIKTSPVKYDTDMSDKDLQQQEKTFISNFKSTKAILLRMKDIFKALEYMKFRQLGVEGVKSLLKEDFILRDNSGITTYTKALSEKTSDKCIRSGQFQILMLNLLDEEASNVFACLNISTKDTQGQLSKAYTWVAKTCETSEDEEGEYMTCLKTLKEDAQIKETITKVKQQLCIE